MPLHLRPPREGIDEDDKRQMKMMEEIGAGSDGYTRFKDNLQFALRVTVFACVLATTVWVPMVRKLFPRELCQKVSGKGEVSGP